MTPDRLAAISSPYARLTIAIVGDFCLDRYLEIDPALQETSIETGLPVHNVIRLRAQPGGAGTILNNLAALGVGRILPVSFCGDDGEGYELRKALAERPGVVLDHFVIDPDRRTFTYCKPLIVEPGRPPVELNRLDSKNWTPTPQVLESRLIDGLRQAAAASDALIILDQVDRPETGVVTRRLLEVVAELADARPQLPVLADSRRGLRGWPRLSFKMNAAELAAFRGEPLATIEQAARAAVELADRNQRPVFITLAEQGIVAAAPGGLPAYVPALPVEGPIDVVGAGDAVSANLAAALAAGASISEAIELAAIASSIVIHQLGTTGTASIAQIAGALDRLQPATSIIAK
jgi:rfaE bifunctional protein kinase chain/domain